ncbi:glycosyltransferase family 39 protein [Verminephrobacter eiseniae]|uniref:glycosyltransferase family 39 protein n=1 Tax=Verminephrobacter eiseniae TaxID=364317 RepID=UPI002238A016|nr:glycosyltransferase family 39 protein [Verminephrobacter eiseniae]MCW5233468.1 hypothetical protein [Verminephrobacter eiseniae]MCW5294980.1 hypothetical protein [Verminephrobacter eiseniae]MCW8184227.1 hypothetical protein [Verminephrobacter eiseniae]MCW8222764.1 hypothetical protein [Verminephrobacter eiseniae]MCW8234207.1 hypothetical protein [Verminephrobacter eiseniae]
MNDKEPIYRGHRPRRQMALWLGFSVALAALTLYLRFHELATQGLWSDELFSVSSITQVGAGRPWYAYEQKSFPYLRMEDSFLTWKASENSPPLFEVLLWLWCQVFGWSDFAVRSMSALLGSLAPLVLFIGLRRPLGAWSAAGAALIFALSPSAVTYAQEVRGYALLMLLASIAVVRLVRYVLADDGQRSHWGSSFKVDVAIYLLLSYTHYTGLVLACGLTGLRWVLAKRRGWPLREFGWFAALPALLAPWLYLNWFAMASAGAGHYGWSDYAWADVWSFLLPKATEFFLPQPSIQVVQAFIGLPKAVGVFLARPYALPATLTLALLGAALGAYKRAAADAAPRRVHDPRWLLCLGLALLVVMHFGYGIYTAFHARVWHARYFSAMLPVGMAVFALLFSLAGQHRLARLFPLCAVLLACAVSVPTLRAYYQNPGKEDYREASRYIVQNTQGRPTVVATWAANAAYYNYYLRRFMADAGRSYELTTVGQSGDLTAGVAALCQRRWAPGEQVVLFQHSTHRLYFDMVNRHCAGALQMVSERQFRGLFVNFYQTTGAAASPQ